MKWSHHFQNYDKAWKKFYTYLLPLHGTRLIFFSSISLHIIKGTRSLFKYNFGCLLGTTVQVSTLAEIFFILWGAVSLEKDKIDLIQERNIIREDLPVFQAELNRYECPLHCEVSEDKINYKNYKKQCL